MTAEQLAARQRKQPQQPAAEQPLQVPLG